MADDKIKKLLDRVFAGEALEASQGRAFTELKCWDSLHYVQLVVAVQSLFAIELDRRQIAKITTLSGLLDVLKEHGIAS